ncbi:MAG: uridine kinase [Actinomycetia bacterium]|nr:uridine kinase [Actinomycetes bacterium]MCP3912913.1 uridine kinase [Actinomycetes bacterium]MCP4084418.1 uridine kinase [Actinomycetes bacterium]
MSNLVIGIAGGSGSGKTTLTAAFCRRAGPDAVSVITSDAYYHDLGHLEPAQRRLVNYDHPDSIDGALFVKHLDELRAGRPAEVPDYDFATHTRTGGCTMVEPRRVVVAEGVLLGCDPGVFDRLDFLVFVHAPAEVRLARRIARDQRERGRHRDDTIRQFHETVAPMHDVHVEPYRGRADRVVFHSELLPDVVDELHRAFLA